jgi:hypothetical protein
MRVVAARRWRATATPSAVRNTTRINAPAHDSTHLVRINELHQLHQYPFKVRRELLLQVSAGAAASIAAHSTRQCHAGATQCPAQSLCRAATEPPHTAHTQPHHREHVLGKCGTEGERGSPAHHRGCVGDRAQQQLHDLRAVVHDQRHRLAHWQQLT